MSKASPSMLTPRQIRDAVEEARKYCPGAQIKRVGHGWRQTRAYIATHRRLAAEIGMEWGR